ncbi:META domain-containing protein [Kribbella swartbergensis]
MSNTDLEDDLRGVFDRAAATVPPATGLTERATAGARKAQRRTWIISGAAAVAVAGIAVTVFSLGGGPSASEQPPVAGAQTPAASTSVQAPLSASNVSGTWQPVQMVGVSSLKAPRPDDPVLVLRADGTWTGSDGCNGLQGTYSIGQDGEFTATAGPQRLMGCDNVPHTAVLKDAARVTLDGDTLMFLGGDGRELARYARAR